MCIPYDQLNSQAPQLPQTPKSEQLKTYCYIILVVHAIISIVKLFIFGFSSAFGDVISCIVLWCGTQQTNYCCMLVQAYMLFVLVDAFQFFVIIGYSIQTGSYETYMSTAIGGALIAFVLICFIFYCLAVACSYQTYKEFKAIFQEQFGELEQMGFASNPLQYNTLNSQQNTNGDTMVTSFTGGQAPAGQQNQNQNSSRQQQKAYKPFQGQGKRLGDF